MVKVVRSTIVDAPVELVWGIVRDFDGLASWLPAVGASAIDRRKSPEVVGAIRKLTLADGAELREQLLTLSDLEMTFSYCMLETPLPLFNYVAHVRLLPVTDGNRTFWSWEARFTTRAGEEEAMSAFVGEHVFAAGFEALKKHPDLAV